MNQPPNYPYGAAPPPGGYGQPPGYSPPGSPGFSGPGAPPPGNAAAKVSLPATLMLVFSGLAILLNIVSILMNLLGAGMGALSGSEEALSQVASGTMGVVMAAVGLLFNAVVIFGALKMKKLEGHTFALISSVLFALPCSVCCFINTPIGIWSLVTLLDKDVKASFRS